MSINIINKINNKYVPKWGNEKKYIAIHYLGVVGQNDKIESNGTGAHFYIDWSGNISQAVDYDAIVWQVGTGGYYTQLHPYARNSNTIGIEMCVKCTGNAQDPHDPGWYFTKETEKACIELTKYLMQKFNIPIENVLRHGDITNKWCPAPYMNNPSLWKNFKAKLTDVSPIEPQFEKMNCQSGAKGLICTANLLNVRNYPEKGEPITTISKGQSFYPTQRSVGNAFSEYWFGKDNQWICGKYVYGWVYDDAVRQWWYIENGVSIKDTWKWIDGKCYFFKKDGYLATNCFIKSNNNTFCWVNADGAWIPEDDSWDVYKWNVIE